ncbi:TRAP transporter small permease [Histophilus somni]|uniref:TRAP transporter small permease protein n=1 Tax=Histophilus somni TaxID=731 RepID=A0A9Q7E4J2_HISSO|nr:TRAP transporter small permease [Histophilus somni]ACA30953.1 Tripartite ATP-independent periplasmic transporter DctQ component [Histophilus somni 2336]ARU65020.1 C4-dicarboxylate ABC transporter permease [Histophilus somni]ARU66886.1 C4-dicarboxylate ABC transporter permease [Histophilus somni]ARU68757.1 C4-dicarboxylate ABC transporter permease [Histophilus somni]ARU70639.1 C4-dicarboxylate ABC transporter permease [Histophilus somni]
MRSISLTVTKLLEALVVIILATMSCLVFLNVVLRYGFNSSINITEEVSRYLFVWLAFLGAILAFNENRHVNVTIFIERLSQHQRNFLRLLTDSLMLFCCYLLITGGWIQFQLNLTNMAPISGIPTGITYLASFITGLVIAILLIIRLFSNAGALIKGENK